MTDLDKSSGPALVGVVMGSLSDSKTMREATDVLASLGVAHESRIVSAHRTPEDMVEYAKSAEGRGLEVIIAGAGGGSPLARNDRLADRASGPGRAC